MAGELATARVLAKIVPEEQLIDEIISELQNIKLGIDNKRPVGPMTMLLMKWTDEKRSMQEIFEDSGNYEKTLKLHDSLKNNAN